MSAASRSLLPVPCRAALVGFQGCWTQIQRQPVSNLAALRLSLRADVCLVRASCRTQGVHAFGQAAPAAGAEASAAPTSKSTQRGTACGTSPAGALHPHSRAQSKCVGVCASAGWCWLRAWYRVATREQSSCGGSATCQCCRSG